MVVHVSVEIEINRPPADVRAVFLDFPSWPSWLTNGLTITCVDKGKSGQQLRRGDRLRSDFKGTVLKPVVLENTPDMFHWRGSFHGLLVSHHRFFFKDSEKTPGGTKLVHNEDVKGVLAFLFKKRLKHGKVMRESLRKFNVDIKARAESSGLSEGRVTV